MLFSGLPTAGRPRATAAPGRDCGRPRIRVEMGAALGSERVDLNYLRSLKQRGVAFLSDIGVADFNSNLVSAGAKPAS